MAVQAIRTGADIMSNPQPKRPKASYTTRLAADVVEFLRARPNQAIWLEARVRATAEYDAWTATQTNETPNTGKNK